MSSRLKKVIITLSIFFGLAILTVVGITVFSNLTDITISDFKILDTQNEEIFEEEVYLTATEENYINFKIYCVSSSPVSYKVESSDERIASIANVNGGYRVLYKRPGNVEIKASVPGSKIVDSFNLKINEKLPTTFVIEKEEGDTNSVNEVDLFADGKEYVFPFSVLNNSEYDNFNVSSIEILDTYNKNVIDKVYIDAVNSCLIIKAKESIFDYIENFVLQSKYIDENGKSIVAQTWNVCANIYGNRAYDIQLILSENSSFIDASRIYTSNDGYILDGEKKVDKVILTNEIPSVFIKARLIYTNGDIFDITKEVTTNSVTNNCIYKETKGNYIEINTSKPNSSVVISFTYGEVQKNFVFTYYDLDDLSLYINDYNSFMESRYKEYSIDDNEDGSPDGVCYMYDYWDNRFKSVKVIVDYKGRIVSYMDHNGQMVFHVDSN